jgi:hypothetical protein
LSDDFSESDEYFEDYESDKFENEGQENESDKHENKGQDDKSDELQNIDLGNDDEQTYEHEYDNYEDVSSISTFDQKMNPDHEQRNTSSSSFLNSFLSGSEQTGLSSISSGYITNSDYSESSIAPSSISSTFINGSEHSGSSIASSVQYLGLKTPKEQKKKRKRKKLGYRKEKKSKEKKMKMA